MKHVCKRGLTVHFVQDELVRGEVQLPQVQVGHFSISVLEKQTAEENERLIIYLVSLRL